MNSKLIDQFQTLMYMDICESQTHKNITHNLLMLCSQMMHILIEWYLLVGSITTLTSARQAVTYDEYIVWNWFKKSAKSKEHREVLEFLTYNTSNIV